MRELHVVTWWEGVVTSVFELQVLDVLFDWVFVAFTLSSVVSETSSLPTSGTLADTFTSTPTLIVVLIDQVKVLAFVTE